MDAPSILAIPEEMLPNIAGILHEHGINTESIATSDADDSERFLASMRCSCDGAIVTLTVQREPHVNPDGPVIVYGAGHNLRSQELSKSIGNALVENGAWLPKKVD